MAQVAIAMEGADLRPAHAVAAVDELVHVFRLHGLCKARPAAAAVELVEGREKRLPRDDVDIQARLVMIPVSILKRPLGPILLCDLKLLSGEAGDRLFALCVIRHPSTSPAKLQHEFKGLAP